MGSVPGLERSPGGRNGNPLQYSFLGNPVNRGAQQATLWGCKELDVTEHTHTHTHTHTQSMEHMDFEKTFRLRHSHDEER